MSTITKPRTSFISLFKSLFSSEIDVVETNNAELPKELDEVWKGLDNTAKKTVEEPITSNTSNSSKKGGIRKKYVTPEIKHIKEMTQENLDKMIETLKDDKEIGDK